jgi:hypothetical protein
MINEQENGKDMEGSEICLKGLGKPRKEFSQFNRFPGRDMNPGSGYEMY